MKSKILLILAAAAVSTAAFPNSMMKTVKPQVELEKIKENLGLERVIAFYGEPRESSSATFVQSSDWRYWKSRGAVAAVSQTWYSILQNPLDVGVNVLLNLDYGDNPDPVVCIDEFGFDYDGQIDRKTAEIIKLTKQKKPELHITVWQMRGPVAPHLASVYRQHVDLIFLESYVNLDNAWVIPFQLQAARLSGLLEKSVIGFGICEEARELGGWAWTGTRDELEQQVRLIRFVAPESPGVAFFGYQKLKECPLTAEDLDEVCGQFMETPADGTGLRPELLELGKTFTAEYEMPALFCSSSFAAPNYSPGHLGPDGNWTDWGLLAEPQTFRVLVMNLGGRDAEEVIVRLTNPGRTRDVFAKGIVDIPKRSTAVAVLPVLPGKEWKGWQGSWGIEIEAPGIPVFVFWDARLWN